jgi:hypothetical protein
MYESLRLRRKQPRRQIRSREACLAIQYRPLSFPSKFVQLLDPVASDVGPTAIANRAVSGRTARPLVLNSPIRLCMYVCRSVWEFTGRPHPHAGTSPGWQKF